MSLSGQVQTSRATSTCVRSVRKSGLYSAAQSRPVFNPDLSPGWRRYTQGRPTGYAGIAYPSLTGVPNRAIMIGDSHNDTQVAINAKVRSIAVSYGYRRHPVEELGADIIVDNFADIPGALARLSGMG